MNPAIKNLQKHAKGCIAGIEQQQAFLESKEDLPLKQIVEATTKIRAYEDAYNLINYFLQLKDKEKEQSKIVAINKPAIITTVN